MRTQNPNLEGRTNAEIISSNPDMFDIKTDRGFFQNTMDNVGNFVRGIESLVSKVPTPGKILGKALGISKPKLSKEDVAFNKSGDMYSNSMGNKFNKYGIAKVSAFGNYADYVDKKSVDLEDAYAAAIKKLTKQGLTPAQIAQRTKDLRERNEYYKAEKQRKIDAENKKREREQQALNNAYNAQSQSKKDQIQRSTGGQFDGASSKQEYNSDPTSFSGSSRDGGLMGYGGKSGTPRYQQYFKGGIVSLRGR